jgi:hypothetical protein
VSERERELLAEVVEVGRTGVMRKGTVAYLLIYSSDTYLPNTYLSLSLSLSLSLTLQESSALQDHKSVLNRGITLLKRNLFPSWQIHDELLILPLICSLFLFLCSFVLPLDPNQTPETRVVETVSTNHFLRQVLYADHNSVEHMFKHLQYLP